VQILANIQAYGNIEIPLVVGMKLGASCKLKWNAQKVSNDGMWRR
jgi:hypothetical protein